MISFEVDLDCFKWGKEVMECYERVPDQRIIYQKSGYSVWSDGQLIVLLPSVTRVFYHLCIGLLLHYNCTWWKLPNHVNGVIVQWSILRAVLRFRICWSGRKCTLEWILCPFIEILALGDQDRHFVGCWGTVYFQRACLFVWVLVNS